MPCDTPLWRPLLNCLRLPPRLPFAGFRAWQWASSARSLFFSRSRDNLLCCPSCPTSGPHPAKETEASLPMFLRSSSSSTFGFRGGPRCCSRLQWCLQGFSQRLSCAAPKVALQRRLFAVVLLRCAETAVCVLLTSFGHDFTTGFLRPKEVLLRRAPDLVLALHTLWFKSAFAPFPTQLCGHIVLASRFLPQICPRISEHESPLMRIRTPSHTLRRTLSFPNFHVA